jgi:hypothetical protein
LGISIKKGRGMRMTSIKMVLLTAMVLSRLIMADQNEDMRALRPDALSYPGSTPEIVSPFDSAELQEIQQCVCQLKTIVESGFDYVESQIDYIESQIDILLGCAVTPIQGSIVITVPGSYCLANDITGDIEIAVSGVTLWLNECQICKIFRYQVVLSILICWQMALPLEMVVIMFAYQILPFGMELKG